MFKVLILVCSVSLAPADCQSNTALDVIVGPEAADEAACGFNVYVAESTIGRRLRGDEYVKVSCTRTTIGKNVG